MFEGELSEVQILKLNKELSEWIRKDLDSVILFKSVAIDGWKRKCGVKMMMQQITLFNCRPMVVLKIGGIDSSIIKRLIGVLWILR